MNRLGSWFFCRRFGLLRCNLWWVCGRSRISWVCHCYQHRSKRHTAKRMAACRSRAPSNQMEEDRAGNRFTVSKQTTHRRASSQKFNPHFYVPVYNLRARLVPQAKAMFREYPHTLNLPLNSLVLVTERSKWNCAFAARAWRVIIWSNPRAIGRWICWSLSGVS